MKGSDVMAKKVNMSELIAYISWEHEYYQPEIKLLIQDIFIATVLEYLQEGYEVALPRLGVLYTKKSQKPTLAGEYLRVPKFRSSPVAKRIINQKDENI